MASDTQVSIPLPSALKERIARLAAARHTQVATLIKPWVIERLDAEEAKERERK